MIRLNFPRLFRRQPRILSPRRGFELWADSYRQEEKNALIYLEEKYLLPLLETVDFQGRSVVDFGCGTGRYLRRAINRGARIAVGVDFSMNMLSVAGNTSAPPSQCLVNASLAHLPFRNELFDVGVSTLVLGTLDNVETSIAEMCRILNAGGTLVVSEFHPEATKRGWQRTFSIEHESGDRETVAIKNYVRPVSYYLRVLEKVGMKAEVVLEPRIDETLRPFFVSASKEKEFEQAFGTPILFVFKLRRV